VQWHLSIVMAGLVPAIHDFLPSLSGLSLGPLLHGEAECGAAGRKQSVDGRHKAGHDDIGG
jgi:hypothetical protein